MSHRAALEALFDDWRAGRLDAIADRFAPDAVWHFSAATKSPAIGREAIMAFLTAYAAGAVTTRLRLLRAAEEGDTLFIEAVEDFDTAAGRSVLVPYAGVLTFRDGRIIDWRDYFDRALVDGQIAGTAALPDYAQDLLEPPAR